MIYRVLKAGKTANMTKHGDYSSMEEAEKVCKSLKTRSKKREVTITIIPEHIGVGYEIYKADGTLYGTIMKETKSFYFVDPAEGRIENELDRPFFLKDDFLDKFENGTLKAVDGDPDKIQKYEQSIEDGDDLGDLLFDEEDDTIE